MCAALQPCDATATLTEPLSTPWTGQVALANLEPVAKVDEMDSYMYQTVGHEAVEWIAQVLRIHRAPRGRTHRLVQSLASMQQAIHHGRIDGSPQLLCLNRD